MPEQCVFPTCKSNACGGLYCVPHERVYGTGTSKKKATTAIPKVSEHRKATNREYAKINKAKLGAGLVPCQIRYPGVCTHWAQGQNHIQKRSPGNIADPGNLEDSCNACNTAIENDPAWAKKNGHFVSKFATKPVKRR